MGKSSSLVREAQYDCRHLHLASDGRRDERSGKCAKKSQMGAELIAPSNEFTLDRYCVRVWRSFRSAMASDGCARRHEKGGEHLARLLVMVLLPLRHQHIVLEHA